MEPTRQPELLTAGDGRPIRIGSDVLLVKALTGIADGVTLLETVAKPGEPAPLDHVHLAYDEVFYVVEGDFEFRIGDRRVRAQAGSVVTAPRGTPHTFKNCSDGDGRVLIVGAPGRAALMLEEIGAMVAGAGPLPEDGLAGVYNRHDTTLVAPLAAEDDEPHISKA